MSILLMYKKCPHCRASFSYDPSVGDLGRVCPKCGHPVSFQPDGLHCSGTYLKTSDRQQKQLIRKK